MDKYIGRLLDNRYEILEVIGTGGMAVVYKARCHRLNRLVAIKILKDDYLEDEDFRSRFHTESQAVAMLSHPNIVSVYDVSTSISLEADYIVMELIEGISLKQYMEKKKCLNWKETLHFAIQIAKALQHAHSRGIVHRDIKPHNVMVLKNGSVKVTDFGIARMMSQGNTLTKEALGSVHYISPEQAKGGRVDDRSDLYSLGVVMYEMMCGKPPYDGDSPVAVAIQHINGGAAMPSTLNPNIPGGLEQIIMKAMAQEPGKRYSSATEMLHDMDEFRKDPTILFDYNIPPLEAVTNLRRDSQVLEMNGGKTTAERVADRSNGQRRSSQSKVARNGDAQRNGRGQSSQRRKPEPKEEESSRVATIAIIVCSVVAVIAIVVFLIVWLGGSNPPDEEPVTVPVLVGKYYEDARQEYPQLQIVIEERRYDEEQEAGIILDQEPQAGTTINSGDTVGVIVSDGPVPEVVTMKNLVNYTEQMARDYLDSLELDLQITVEQKSSDDVEEGSIISTDPVEGEVLEEGQKVTLVISTGPEMKISAMPDIIDVSLENAQKTLENQKLHLQIKTEEVFDSVIVKGNVVNTDPAVGKEIKTGQTVTLYISKGPELKTMPNVVGMDIGNAYSVLDTAGFTKIPVIDYVDSNEDKDVVVEQSEEAYTEVDANTEITLKVSKGPKETQPSMPAVTTKTVTLSLPADSANDYTLDIRLDGETVQFVNVKAGQTSVSISLTGNGTQTYELYIDGVFYRTEKVDFTTNG